MGMDDLLGSLLGGGKNDPDGQDDNPMDDLVGDLLGSVLGGGQQGGAAGLLGGLLGGGGGQGGGLGGLLGGLLGGGGGSQDAGELNPLMAPLANMLADRLGLSPQMAQMVMGFVLGKMADTPNPGQPATRGVAPQGGGGLNLDNLLEQMNQGGVDKSFVQAQGLDKELAEQTGLDQEKAAESLEQVLNMFGGQMAKQAGGNTPAAPKSTGMDSLLDDWK